MPIYLPERMALVADALTPREIVAELDKYIVGQAEAKRKVAIALRNRWRRQQLGDDMRDEVTPKNIILIGPTGGGKTEIARRLARLVDAPLLLVHMSEIEAIETLRQAQKKGLKIFGETCPQYIALTADDIDKPGVEGAMQPRRNGSPAKSTPTPAGFPKVDAETQKGRDDMRRRVLSESALNTRSRLASRSSVAVARLVLYSTILLNIRLCPAPVNRRVPAYCAISFAT